jgi:hypothetical protein
MIGRVRFAIAVLTASCLMPLASRPAAAQTHRRSMVLDDLAKLKTVGDPQASPDGKDPGQFHSITMCSHQRDRLER